MPSVPTATESLTYELVDRRQFAIQATLIGGCVGGTAAIAGGGAVVLQLVLAVLVATIVSGGLYLALLVLADSVTDGAPQYQVQVPAAGTATSAGRQRPADDTSPPNAR